MLEQWLLHFALILSVRMTSNITGSLKSRNNNKDGVTYRTEPDCNISAYYRLSNQFRIEKQNWVWPEVYLCERLNSLPLEPEQFWFFSVLPVGTDLWHFLITKFTIHSWSKLCLNTFWNNARFISIKLQQKSQYHTFWIFIWEEEKQSLQLFNYSYPGLFFRVKRSYKTQEEMCPLVAGVWKEMWNFIKIRRCYYLLKLFCYCY